MTSRQQPDQLSSVNYSIGMSDLLELQILWTVRAALNAAR